MFNTRAYIVMAASSCFLLLGCYLDQQELISRRGDYEKRGFVYDMTRPSKPFTTEVVSQEPTVISTEEVIAVDLQQHSSVTSTETTTVATDITIANIPFDSKVYDLGVDWASEAEITSGNLVKSEGAKIIKGVNDPMAYCFKRANKLVRPLVRPSDSFECMTIHITESEDHESPMRHHAAEKKWEGLGYHLLIGEHGEIYHGFRWMKQKHGAHGRIHNSGIAQLIAKRFAHFTKKDSKSSKASSFMNNHSIGVAVIGFSKDGEMKPAQQQALSRLHKEFCKLYRPDFKVTYHNRFRSTTCPGEENAKIIEKTFKGHLMNMDF